MSKVASDDTGPKPVMRTLMPPVLAEMLSGLSGFPFIDESLAMTHPNDGGCDCCEEGETCDCECHAQKQRG